MPPGRSARRSARGGGWASRSSQNGRPKIDGIGGDARPDGREQPAPRVRHTPAERVEIEPQEERFVQQRAGCVVELEAARRRFRKDAFARQVPQDAVERIAIGVGGFGERSDSVLPAAM